MFWIYDLDVFDIHNVFPIHVMTYGFDVFDIYFLIYYYMVKMCFLLYCHLLGSIQWQ